MSLPSEEPEAPFFCRVTPVVLSSASVRVVRFWSSMRWRVTTDTEWGTSLIDWATLLPTVVAPVV
ncbi:hypothetical protein D3C81_1782670 [compost metagenome]